MPTIARIGPYRIYFYGEDRKEPPHVHVDRDDNSAKFWLAPVGVAHNFGFRPKELRDIYRIIASEAENYLEIWHDKFGPQARNESL